LIQDLEILPLVMGLGGGLALFLFGMEQMSDALKAVAGDRMRTILGRLTKNRVLGVMTGALVTAVIQSSSVTTVLVVGFITAGLMSLAQSIGVIMGANIGTTITAQIVAFKVTKFSLGMIAVGFALLFVSKRERLRHHGAGIMGLGLVFLGMSMMGDAMQPLRSYEPFIDWMTRLEDPWVGILAGAVFTALVQSSSATTGVVIALASQGLISLPAGIAIAFGANIGTCVTAMLASLGKPREAVRAAVVHVLFNVAGVLVWIGLIDRLVDVVTVVSPKAAGLPPADRLAAVTPRQIANAHTIFNVSNTVLFLGFVPVFARIVERLVPDRPLADETASVRARYLDPDLINTPFLALDRARLELIFLGEFIQDMLADTLPTLLDGSAEELDALEKRDDLVDELHGKIVTYLGQISGASLTEAESVELIKLMGAANDLESIGDIIETNLVGLGRRRLEGGVVISEVTREVLGSFEAVVASALDSALLAATQKNLRASELVVKMKDEVNELAESASLHEARRLVAAEPNRLKAYTIEVDVLSNLKRIYYYSKRIARIVPALTPGRGDRTPD